MESLREGEPPRSKRRFLYTIHNGELCVPHLLANGIIFYCSADFHDTELRHLKTLARKYGDVVPYHRWSQQDFERANNPRKFGGGKIRKGGWGEDCEISVLYPLGLYPLARTVPSSLARFFL